MRLDATNLRELDALVRFLEKQAMGMQCSVLILDGDRLRHGAAPSLPAAYSRAIDGIPIGPRVGSCGTAAWRREPVIVRDIANDPLWSDFRALAHEHGLAACWSTPILGRDGALLGTFAMYYGEPRSPTPQDEQLIATATLLAGALIERAQAGAALEHERSRLATFFQHAPAFIAVLRGPDHVFELANPPYHRLVGRREIIGRPAREALADVEGQGFFELLDGVYATGQPYIGSGERIRLQPEPGGPAEERVLDFVYQPIVEPDGTVTGIITHGVDVTPMYRAADEMRRARDAAEAANRAKTQFLATMSHELRTPLNAIGGFTELLLLGVRGSLTAQQRSDIERIRQSQEHLLRLITDMLNLTKIEAGAVEYHLRDVPVHEALWRLETITEPLVRERRLQLHVTRPDDALTARADPDKLQQILVNLLSNALKFTEPGGRIDVSCASGPAGVTITVTDTGIGIPTDRVEHIFEPFVQVDASHSRRFGGVGLGLAISRDLARGMGGDLTVESAFGEGSRFTLRLPAAAGLGTRDSALGSGVVEPLADVAGAPQTASPARTEVRPRDESISP